MSDSANCKVEAEECDAYEEGNEEPVAMIEESPSDTGHDGQCNSIFLHFFQIWKFLGLRNRMLRSVNCIHLSQIFNSLHFQRLLVVRVLQFYCTVF
jgi:hypothetical protein